MWVWEFVLTFLACGLGKVRAEGLYKTGCQYSCGREFPHTMCMSEYWDDELEKMARIWASQCEPANDRCRKLRRFEVGQNVGLLVSEENEETLQSSLNTFVRWVNPGKIRNKYFLQPELVRLHPNPRKKEILTTFFQVIWPHTYLLGCAEAVYERNGFRHRLLVCNYGPSAFDRKNVEIFSSRTPCSGCPRMMGCPRHQNDHPFSNLCTIPSYETKPGEAERIEIAIHTLLKLTKTSETQILQGGRDLGAAEGPFGKTGGGNWKQHEGRKSVQAGKEGISEEVIDYCSIKCNGGRSHVMCQPKMKPNKFCQEKKLVPESESKYYLTRKFNELRNQVAGGLAPHWPKASNMRMLIWDAELTKLATTWAQTCPSQRDGCRDVGRFRVNQIVSLSVASQNNNKSLAPLSVEIFLKAADSFPVQLIDEYDLPVGDTSLNSILSQILWANTSRIGCAEVLYVSRTDPDAQDSSQYSSLVCNFGEAGNVSGKRMYNVGEPCSECSKGTSCSEGTLPNLCVERLN